MRLVRHACVLAALLAAAMTARAATLPAHRPLRVLIVSDEVNPHGLSDADLTQPGDLAPALRAPGAALNLDPAPDGVLELPTNDLARATALLSVPPCDPAAYDVLVYFSHRIPDDGPDGQARQDAFTAAVDQFLVGGGGMVSFHHGSYYLPGKEAIVALIGGRATGAVPWEPVLGQDVIAVSPAHFVTTNGLTYDGTRAHADPPRGVPAGDYPFFNNAPDERYPAFDMDPGAGDVEMLFQSDYDGAPRVLGFTHRRPGWRGLVAAWQPGEYQPHACNPADRTFQVLANAIVFVADALSPGDPLLRVTRSAASGARLQWTGGHGAQCVLRSADPADVTTPVGVSDTFELTDPAPPPGLAFYLVGTR